MCCFDMQGVWSPLVCLQSLKAIYNPSAMSNKMKKEKHTYRSSEACVQIGCLGYTLHSRSLETKLYIGELTYFKIMGLISFFFPLGPRWASWNTGVFICIRCAGIHRNLGVHISRVKSVNLDQWTPEQIQVKTSDWINWDLTAKRLFLLPPTCARLPKQKETHLAKPYRLIGSIKISFPQTLPRVPLK